MNIILSFILGAVVGVGAVWVVFYFIRANKSNEAVQDKENFNERQAKEKAEHKQKILDMLSSRDRIANKDVENELKVSDATATRYLDELEKEGIIKQVGTDGQYVYYQKI